MKKQWAFKVSDYWYAFDTLEDADTARQMINNATAVYQRGPNFHQARFKPGFGLREIEYKTPKELEAKP